MAGIDKLNSSEEPDQSPFVEAMPDNERDPYFDFQNELSKLINRHSIDTRMNNPDFILAEYVVENLRALEHKNRAYHFWSQPSIKETATTK